MSTAVTPSVVHVRRWPAWFFDGAADESVVLWHEDMTLRSLVPADMRSNDRLRVYVNHTLVEDLDRLADPRDFIDIATSPSATPAALVVAQIFASLAISAALHFLVPKPKGPKRRGDEESPSQAWSGVRNVRGEGQPKQVCYGEHRAVPQILDEFIVNVNAPAESYYKVILSLGEGPVYQIGDQLTDTPQDEPLSSELGNILTGVQINGNDLRNFDGVEAHVRMGTNDQAPIRGFEYINTPYEVDAVLDQQAFTSGQSTATLAFATYNSNAAGDQDIWDEYAFGFSMTGEADAWEITIAFQSGLYSIDNDGDFQDAPFQMLVRYRELDSIGDPITTGGDHGDGWVYELPQPMFFAHNQSAFNYKQSGFFRNPQTYTPGTVGNCLVAGGVNDYGTTTTNPTVPASWVPGSQPGDFSWCGWVSFDSLPTTAGIAHQPIIEWGNTGTNGGWAFGISKRNSLGAWRWYPTFYNRSVSGGTTVSEVLSAGSGAGVPILIHTANRYYFLAVTYKKQVSGGNRVIKIYVDGQLSVTRTSGSSSDNIGGITAIRPIEVFRSTGLVKQVNGGVDVYTAGKGDEFQLFSRELTIQEIQGLYNGGVGVSGQTGDASMIAAWHFDNTSSSTTANYAPSGAPNNLALNNGAATTTGGIVLTSSPNDIKRSTYEVQAMRWNKTSDSTAVAAVQDEATWLMLTGKYDEWLSYPNTALLALSIKATDQMNSLAPLITVHGKWRLVPHWDGVSASSPNITHGWSQNPAWIALDVITNKRYGAGNDFEFTQVVLDSLMELAVYADALVYDGRGSQQAIHESDTSKPISDILYDSTLNGGDTGLQLVFRNVTSPSEPPSNWFVGGYVGFTGLPSASGTVVVDINTTNIAGFKITDISFNGGSWIVTLAYDFATYGAPWPDGQYMANASTATVSGTAEGREPRYQYDNQHDTFSTVWDTLIDILSTCRATPALEGNKVRVRYQRPRTAVDVVNHASIKPGSFEVEYPGRLDRPNSYVCEFFDRNKNYERSPASQDDPDLDAGTLEENINRENMILPGVTRRSQVIRELLWRLKTNRLSDRLGRYSSGAESISSTVNDVVQVSHDIVPWGTGGRILNDLSSTTSIYLDRTVVLAAATSYFLRVCDADAGQEMTDDGAATVYRTTTVSSIAGTYPLGSTLTVAALPFIPAKGDKYVLYAAGEEFLAELVDTSLSPEMGVDARWVKYDADAHDVDTLVEILPATSTDDGVTETTVPRSVESMLAVESTKRTNDGTHVTEIAVSWVHDPATARIVTETAVYARIRGAFERVGSTTGNQLTFTPRVTRPGTVIEVAVQARGVGGLAFPARRSPSNLVTLTGIWQAPQPPTNFTATLEGDQVVYAWTPPANSQGYSYELRRGGWELGQPIGIAPPGSSSFGPTRNWASADDPASIYIRSRDSRGQFSAAVKLSTFNPVVDGSVVLAYPTVTEQQFHADYEWSDEWSAGEPWYHDMDLNSPLHTGLERTQLDDGSWVLEFAGSNLTGVYQSRIGALPTRPPYALPEEVYVEIFAEAYVVSPLTMADMTLTAGDPRMSNYSFEGPLLLGRDEAKPCALAIEIAWTNESGATDWKPYRPGIYRMIAARYRVTVTRASTDYQVRIVRFHTRISRVAQKVFERTGTASGMAARLLRYG